MYNFKIREGSLLAVVGNVPWLVPPGDHSRHHNAAWADISGECHRESSHQRPGDNISICTSVPVLMINKDGDYCHKWYSHTVP